jgi:hypothetical protein
MMKGAMECDVFGFAQLVVNQKRENTSKRELMERSTGELSLGELLLDGAWREDDGLYLRAVVTENREISLVGRGRDAKNTVTKRGVFVTVGRDESNTAGFVWGEGTIVI